MRYERLIAQADLLFGKTIVNVVPERRKYQHLLFWIQYAVYTILLKSLDRGLSLK